MAKLFIEDLDVKGKRVLMRVDFNVPLSKKDGSITDDSRIKASLPSIRYVIEHGGSLVLMSHLGRPDGKVVPALSMKPASERLSRLLGRPVAQLGDCVGPEVEKFVLAMKPGSIAMLENLRFHPEEEENEESFSRALASLGDLYVNDAFGTAHRAHASTAGVARYMKAGAAGYLMRDEIKYLGDLLRKPGRPFVVILGGAKISTKIGVIRNLLKEADCLLIGGAMSYTFLKAQRMPVGASLVEDDRLAEAASLVEQATREKKELLLPIDHLVARKVEEGSETMLVGANGIGAGWIGVDIGPGTIERYGEQIASAKTIFWNGPMGIFEIKKFSKGTEQIARMVAESGAVSVVGGGDSVAAINQLGLTDKITHVSTGGGASLEYLEGKKLPGIEALTDSNKQ
ncbi:MAG: phosphoglycerate kinase [Candidatus Aureabacteria bacterium]|nr:phosphoglycerate kinase [Candidatus Auribacterota bacterium]